MDCRCIVAPCFCRQWKPSEISYKIHVSVLYTKLGRSPKLRQLDLSFFPSLQAKHAREGNTTWGVDGDKGVLADMKELGVWDPLSVKVQTFKTAIEVCLGGSGCHRNNDKIRSLSFPDGHLASPNR